MQEADRMSVAIHPSETRQTEGRAPARFRLPLLASVAGGSVAVIAFAAAAFSFFSGLADPRAKPVQVAPVASQWPDLTDGVPALAPAKAQPELHRADLPVPEPVSAPAPPPAAPVTIQAKAPEPAPEPAPAPAQARLPIEPVQTVSPAARPVAAVAPAKVTVPLPPTRAETVRAKTEQPARFVSLPAPKAKPDTPKEAPKEIAKAKAEPVKAQVAKAEAPKSESVRKPTPPARGRSAETKPTQTASAETPAPQPAREADEPELLGVKIPGGRQIRDGWDAAVNGLLGSKSGGE
ncbi:hypothetical protein [Methylorubrum populi]